LISHHYAFDEMNQAMTFADEGDAIRVTLDF
jgi:Zn-dependent alcohol dehydrogenase